MRYRTLGRTGLEVSEIGFGAWGIGADMWKGAEDETSLAAMRRAIELGVNFIDTAIVYGSGHSEKLVGQIKREHPEVIVASKVNPANREWPAKHTTPADVAFSAEHVVARTEKSLRNLGIDTIDVQQFHVWSDSWVEQGSWLDGIEQLKRDGKIRFFGVSLNDAEAGSAQKLVESGLVDTVQVIYNVFDQAADDELFPACERHNVGVIVRVPLDEGALTGKVRPDYRLSRGRLPQLLLRRRSQGAGLAARADNRRRPRDRDRAAAASRRFASAWFPTPSRRSSSACARLGTSRPTRRSATPGRYLPSKSSCCARTAGCTSGTTKPGAAHCAWPVGEWNFRSARAGRRPLRARRRLAD